MFIVTGGTLHGFFFVWTLVSVCEKLDPVGLKLVKITNRSEKQYQRSKEVKLDEGEKSSYVPRGPCSSY